MAAGTFFHYIGSALLFIAMILTIVVDISAPVVNDISFANVDLRGDATAKFGVFGYCYQRSNGEETCSSSRIGYNPARILETLGSGNISNSRTDTTSVLTRALILHPIGSVILFFTFLLSLLSGSVIAGVLVTLCSAVAFIINAIAVIVDFVMVSLLRTAVRKNGYNITYGVATWLALVAAVLTFVAALLMMLTCCAGRRRRRAAGGAKVGATGY